MTLAEARELRSLWLDAERAVATGQSYTIGSRSLTRADARLIAERLAYYDSLVTALTAGRAPGVRAVRVIPRDL